MTAEEKAKQKWNSEADEWNQWDNLSQEEKDELTEEEISLANASDQRHLPAEEAK
jgi:hypothetical protein